MVVVKDYFATTADGKQCRTGRLVATYGNDRPHRAGGQRSSSGLVHDLRTAFPYMKGFLPRSLKYMRAFADAWPDSEFVQEVLAQLLWYHPLTLPANRIHTFQEAAK